MTAADYGLQTPKGTDLISQGDDAITHNAERTAELIDQMGFRRSPLASSQHLDSLSHSGGYLYSGSFTVERGYPKNGNGRVTIIAMSPAASVGTMFAVIDDESAAAPELYVREKMATWRPWRQLAGVHPDLTASSDIDALRLRAHSGSRRVPTRAIATALGIPGDSPGILDVEHVLGSDPGTSYAIHTFKAHGSALSYERHSGYSGWSEWERTDIGAVSATSPVGFRTVPLALTLGNAGTSTAPASGAIRFPLRFNAPITRWRLHIANVNPRHGSYRAGEFDFTGLWIGEQRLGGAFESPTEQLLPAWTIGDGEEWTSPWMTADIGGDLTRLLAFGYTSTGGTPYALAGGSWRTEDPSDAGDASVVASREILSPFSVWIEAETYASTPVLAVAGDSLSCGIGATLPVHDSVASQYMRDVGGLPVHYAHSGDSMGGSLNPEAYKWRRFAGTDRPDAILWAIGANDAFASVSLETMKERHGQYAEILRTLSPNIYGATLTPRNTDQTPERTAVRRDYNEWLETQPNGIRDLFDFVSPISGDDLTIDSAFNADNVHLNTAGYGAQREQISRRIVPPVLTTAI